MSVKPGSVATHIPPSLPSFAQTFSSSSLSSYGPDDNSLPPIHDFGHVERPSIPILPRHRSDEDAVRSGRKRTHAEASSSRTDEHLASDRDSPSLTRVKEEPEQDMLVSSPAVSVNGPDSSIHDTSGAPPPSFLNPTKSKKRRVTISGAPALNTDVRIAPDQTNSTPISPVVIGFTIQRDNPSEVEQVRSMLTVKQQQQALIEQRRGSTSGILSPTVAAGPSAAAASEVHLKSSLQSSRSIRRSPNSGIGNRRHNVVTQAGPNRPSSPNTNLSQPLPTSTPSHSLPPPPISFARRRANQMGGGKKKPADIMISPRDAHTPDQFAPSIQSAPPIPHAAQQGGSAGRFPMALPRLPSVMGDNVRRTTGGNVPPTPTRFSAQRMAVSQGISHPIPGISGRSPPNASVAISSTLVPSTPSALQTPGYTGEKSAFLAPFESFYDALNDSKHLKTWLGDQLQRSKVLIQNLTQQQDKLNETVDNLVEKKVSGMRTEINSLHRRVEELEDALRVATSSRRPSLESSVPSTSMSKGKQPVRNGNTLGSTVTEGYTFPPATIDRERFRSESSEHRMSPGWAHDKDPRDTQDSDNGSPAPYESRRLSLSSSRLEPPRSQSMENVARPFASPSLPFRDGSSVSHPPPSSSKFGRGGRPSGTIRQHSSPRLPGSVQDLTSTSSPRREESQRNSIVDSTMDDRES